MCCSEGQMYDATINKCIIGSTDTSLVNDALVKGTSINSKPDVILTTNGMDVEPFAGKSFGKV